MYIHEVGAFAKRDGRTQGVKMECLVTTCADQSMDPFGRHKQVKQLQFIAVPPKGSPFAGVVTSKQKPE